MILVNKFYLLPLICFMYSCDFTDNRLHLTNNANYTISVAISEGNQLGLNNRVIFYLKNTISSRKTKFFPLPSGAERNAWSQLIRASDSKILSFYIFKIDTLRKYDSNLKILELVKLAKTDTVLMYSERQLDSLNWHITYTSN